MTPTRSRLSPGELVAATAGVALLVSLFLPWFREESVGRFGGAGDPAFRPRTLMAWSAVAVVAVLLALLALVPLVNAARRLRTGTSFRPEVNLAVGALAVSLVFFGAALHVGERGHSLPGRPFITASPSYGLGVALLVALALAAGGVLSMWSTRPTTDTPKGSRPVGGP